MSDYVWQPVGEPVGPVELEIEYYTHGDSDTATHYDAGHLGEDWVSLCGEVVTTINWGAHEDYRLCRRVPASAGVPVGAIRKLIAFVDEWGSIGDTEGMPNLWIEVAEARTWLDRITTAEQYAQPQTGQEGDR